MYIVGLHYVHTIAANIQLAIEPVKLGSAATRLWAVVPGSDNVVETTDVGAWFERSLRSTAAGKAIPQRPHTTTAHAASAVVQRTITAAGVRAVCAITHTKSAGSGRRRIAF